MVAISAKCSVLPAQWPCESGELRPPAAAGSNQREVAVLAQVISKVFTHLDRCACIVQHVVHNLERSSQCLAVLDTSAFYAWARMLPKQPGALASNSLAVFERMT